MRTKTNPTTSADAPAANSLAAAPPVAPAANSLAAPPPVAPKPVRLRVRGPTSTTTLDLQTTTPLKDLVGACAKQLGANISNVSFRDAAGKPVTLMSEGAYPAGGALLIGPDSTLNEVGLASGDTLMVQVQSKKKPAPRKKTTTKKKRPRDDDSDEEDVWVPSDGDDDDDAKARRLLGGRASAVLEGGARRGDDAATVAASFINCHEVRCPRSCRGAFTLSTRGHPFRAIELTSRRRRGGGREGTRSPSTRRLSPTQAPEGLMGAAAGMWTSQEAARRVEAARAGRVRVRAASSTLQVYWRATARAKKETEERVRQFSADESVAVVCAILHRQAGSTRRKLSGDKPSTRLLTPEGVATRCPALFWSLYASSRTDPDDESSPGDVQFALEHVVSQAMAKYEADVAALQRGAA